MTELEAAWLAGILEGEGCFDWNREGEGKRWPTGALKTRTAWVAGAKSRCFVR